MSSLSPHNLPLSFCCMLSIFALIGAHGVFFLVFLGFFVLLSRDSVSLLRFSFLIHIQIFLPVCPLKYPYRCLSSHFCFLVVFIFIYLFFLFVPMLLLLLLVATISLSLLFLIYSSRPCIDASVLSSLLASSLPPFLDAYNLSYLWRNSQFPCPLIHLFFPCPF